MTNKGLRRHLLAMVLDADAPPDIMHRAEAFLDRWEPLIEAEARDATGLDGLREALDAHDIQHTGGGFVQCRCGRTTQHAGSHLSDWRDHREQAVRAVLAAAPPEPRWPSRDELAKVIRDAVVRPPSGVCASWLGSGPCPECGSLNAAEWLDQRLAALRDGGERL